MIVNKDGRYYCANCGAENPDWGHVCPKAPEYPLPEPSEAHKTNTRYRVFFWALAAAGLLALVLALR